MPASFTGRLLTSAALALGATLLTTTVALAAPPGWTPGSGDVRATAHAGNVTTCAAAGLPGNTVTWPGLEDATSTYVTIPVGDTILAVVVKGGPAYNVYQGLTAWTRLHAPINVGGQIPTISHWFACVTAKANGGGGTTTTTSPRAAGPANTKAMNGFGSTTGSGSTAGGSTSTTAHVAAAAATANTAGGATTLAATGFADGWLIWVGVLLLLAGAGAGAVALTRTARRRS